MSTESQQDAVDGGSAFNALSFIVQQILGRINTATVVQVLACTNNGGLAPFGMVDLQLLVNQVDGSGLPVPNAIVYNVPYVRVQGGGNAVIIDPEPGDIGIAVFASRDISIVKSTQAQANPGSAGRFDLSDALYIGGILNGVPTQYVQFNADGINVVSPGTVTVNAGADVNVIAAGHADVTAGANVDVTAGGDVVVDAGGSATVTAPSGCTIDANTVINGTLQVRDGVKSPSYAGLTAGSGTMTVHSAVIDTATINGKVVDAHTHSDPQGGTTGPMQ